MKIAVKSMASARKEYNLKISKVIMLALLSLAVASSVMANDCGQHKDKGKGTPTCPGSSTGGNTGGSGGSGGNGGSGGQGGSSTVTNDNLNTVLDSVNNNVRNSNKNTNSNSNSNSNKNDNSNLNLNSNTNKNTNTQDQAQLQGQAQGQKQSATGGTATSASGSVSNATGGASTSSSTSGSTASNGAQSNAQQTSFNDVRQTATAIAPETFPTASCYKTYSGAGQASGFGFSMGGGKIDKGCTAREDARLLAAMGARVAACKVILAQPEVSAAGVKLEDCVNQVK